MKLIVGLGNPGPKYQMTRHNVGFLTIDQIGQEFSVPVNKIKAKALTGEFHHKGEKIILAKPQTFVNKSGISVRALVDYFDIGLDDLIVIYDDIDIPLGTIRIKGKGSPGSHNGMRSISKELGQDGFTRIRISIGQCPPYMDLANYVLANISKEEEEVIGQEIKAAAQAAILIVEEGTDAAMNRFNGMNFND